MRLQGLSSGTVQVEGPQELRPGYCGGLVLSPTGVVGLGTANSTGQGAPLLPLAGHLPPRRVPLATGTRGRYEELTPSEGLAALASGLSPSFHGELGNKVLSGPNGLAPAGPGKARADGCPLGTPGPGTPRRHRLTRPDGTPQAT